MTQSEWRIVGARVQGPGHRDKQRPCDDDFASGSIPGGVVLATADGAGSADHSRHGARLAVRTAVEFIQRQVAATGAPADKQGWVALLAAALEEVRAALEVATSRGLEELERAGQEGDAAVDPAGSKPEPIPLNSLATTLLCVVACESWIGVLHVGDGWAVSGRSGGGFVTLSEPDRGEYANETTFVTSRSYRADARIQVLQADDVRSLALLTDGLEMAAITLATASPFEPMFQEIVREIERASLETEQLQRDLEEFLGSPRIAAKSEDDKTLLVAVRIDAKGGDRQAEPPPAPLA